MKNSEQPINPSWVSVTGEGLGVTTHVTGLTKREYFSALAMQGMLANPNRELVYDSVDDKIKECIMYADALLSELEKR